MKQLKAAVTSETYNEGRIKNLRWMYNPDTLTLSIAENKGFDRWANSRIIEIHPILFSKTDPTLEAVIEVLILVMDKGDANTLSYVRSRENSNL